jgi:uncharacterized membrane protein
VAQIVEMSAEDSKSEKMRGRRTLLDSTDIRVSTEPVSHPSPLRKRPGKRIIEVVTILSFAWLALIFLIRDPLHYLINPTPESFGRFWPNRAWLLVHIIGGLAAILIGPFQFSSKIRRRFLNVHRWSGRSYLVGIFLAGASAFYLSFFAKQANFGIALFALAAVWWFATGLAFIAMRRRRISAHRQWMIRSYIITFAFVTFRWIGILPIWEPFGVHREAAAAWIAWIVPLAIAEIIFRRTRPSATETA